MRSLLRKTRLVAAVAAIALVLVGAIVFAATGQLEPAVNCDAPLPLGAAWSAGGDARTDEGYRLAECGRLIGLTAEDAERLLGPAIRDSEGLAWQMGPDGFGIDFMFLGVTLENGRIAQASVYQG